MLQRQHRSIVTNKQTNIEEAKQYLTWILVCNPPGDDPGNYPLEKIPPEVIPAECSNILKAKI